MLSAACLYAWLPCGHEGLSTLLTSASVLCGRYRHPINFLGLIGPSNVYVNTHEAVDFARRQLLEQGMDVAPRPADWASESASDATNEIGTPDSHYKDAKSAVPVEPVKAP